ncbi:hypothetical protein B4102_2179 [Heyndrickxia sporothermodurans]|uniref:Uncharacterized protein n=1 Tax=Heyndrickxia sporothermodurans TaxID=46224 RepID=A0A150LGI1_9BACI|nr:hypothetical protein [Heyndrickxia sporothermodurans]KYD11451.1 hypothetical protein B4102_2179 [Heyndrickxia sporothermodurans]
MVRRKMSKSNIPKKVPINEDVENQKRIIRSEEYDFLKRVLQKQEK